MTAVTRPSTGTGIPFRDGLRPRNQRRIGYALLALLSYVPILLTAPGKVAADTKQYLYLDPTRLLSRAVDMWDPNIGLGTVTHQNIGYAFPMGPFYWVFDKLGVPDWLAQRIWLGTILLAAGLGMLFLFRTLGLRGPGAVVGALAFMLSPYSLDYAARISVILLPWCALPWMIGLTVRALRTGSWRHAAWFAIVVQLVGGVNATALVFAGIAPVLIIPYMVWVTREVNLGAALKAVGRIGVLTTATSLWWIAGLAIQGSYGIDVLRYTETVQTVAKTSLAPETLRGLGYWFFYGRDKLGPWIEANVDYTQSVPLILLSYSLPTLSLISAAIVRWRYRIYFVLLVLVGVAVAVGAHPYDNPSPLGALFKVFADKSQAGLALRSTGRAVPLVVLGLAALLGAGVNALWAWWHARGVQTSRGLIAAALVGVLVILNLPALWNGHFYGENLQRPEAIPKYWRNLTKDLDRRAPDTRVLELPGADFASYRWGNTVDPITPGMMDRPYVARELIPYGSPPSADLLNAFDRRIQEGVADPNAIAPVARLMGVGDVVLRNDLQFERYNVLRPQLLWQLFQPTPPGLGAPRTFGNKITGKQFFPMLDELALGLPPGVPTPKPVVDFPVKNPEKIVRVDAGDAPLIIAGDGEGLIDAASSGLLNRGQPILYAASYAKDAPALRTQAAEPDAVLVVTDSNRRRARRWSTVRDNLGYTERAGETALVKDPADARLPLFPNATDDSFTVVHQKGAQVSATHYGNPVSYTPEDRAARALDGDPDTAWKVGAFTDVIGEKIRIDLPKPITADQVNLAQPLVGPRDRFITRATLRFDGAHDVPVVLDDTSRSPAGQTITFPKERFSRLEIIVDDTNTGRRADYIGVSAVGFAEIRLADVRVEELVRMPTDLLGTVGTASADRPLVLVMSRLRTTPVPPRYDEELQLEREFTLPTARDFSLGGSAHVSPEAADETLDALLGFHGVTATSSAHLPGSVDARASSAFDGNNATAWTAPFGEQVGAYIAAKTPQPVTFDHLDLRVIADGKHSVPSQLQLDVDGQIRELALPKITKTATVPVRFDPVTGSSIRLTVVAVRPVKTIDYFSVSPIVMPVAVADAGIPGVTTTPGSGEFDTGCRTDLLTVDDTPVSIAITGTRETARARGALEVKLCDAAAVALGSGEHVLRTVPGRSRGLDVDRLVLASNADGAPAPLDAMGVVPSRSVDTDAPTVRVLHNGRTSMQVEVTNATKPFWMVLGQSNNEGWTASAAGQDLGTPQLVDGYANGWPVTPKHRTVIIDLDWTPQRRVWIALLLSAAGMLLCAAIIFVARRRRRATAPDPLDLPALRSPLGVGTRVASTSALITGPLISFVVAGALIRWWAGALVGAAVLAVLLVPRLRPLLTFSPAILLAACGLYVAVQQFRYDYPPTFEWPTFLERLHDIGWLAVALLAADALVELLTPNGLGRESTVGKRTDQTSPTL